jgi:uncharacterized membrane protein YGL010W
MPTNTILSYAAILDLLIAIVYILFHLNIGILISSLLPAHLKKFSRLHMKLEERKADREKNITVS